MLVKTYQINHKNNKNSSGMTFRDGKEWENIIKPVNKVNHQHSKIHRKINKNLGLMTGSD